MKAPDLKGQNMMNARTTFTMHWPLALLVLVVIFCIWHYNMGDHGR